MDVGDTAAGRHKTRIEEALARFERFPMPLEHVIERVHRPPW